MQDTGEHRTILHRLALALGLSALGLFGPPLVFGALPDPTPAIVWLGIAIVDGACLVPVLIVLAEPLANVLSHLPVHGLPPASARRASLQVARLTLGVAYLVLLQAVLRHPLVAVFGAVAEPFLIETSVVVSTMLVLSILIVWLHASVTPLIEALAQTALDAALATSAASESGVDNRGSERVVQLGGPDTEPSQPTQLTSGQSTSTGVAAGRTELSGV